MSSQPQRPLAPEALLQHRQWVRELARRLVADPAAADDLEQQTWLAALRSPPRHDASPRAWLATVLRSWLQKARRTDQRRSHREQLAAGGDPSPSPSTAEIVAQAEAHRAVVDAVFRLNEPLRTTVLLRFFEDLPAAEVAVRTGVPLETVRSRLRRAVELLRVSLDGQSGGRSAWLAALTPLAQQAAVPAGIAATIGLGALVMNTTQKLMLAAVLLVGGATAFLVSMQDSPAPVPASGAGVAAAATGGPVDAGGNAATETADRSVAARAGVPVTVLVRTWNDEPIEGALVDACVPQPKVAEANEYDRTEVISSSALTDGSGAVQFTSLAAGRWHFVAGKPGWCRAGVPDVALRAGVPTEPVVIRLGSGHSLAGRVLAADGRAVAGAPVCVFPTSSSLVRPRTTTDPQGRFRFAGLRAGPTAIAAALPGGTVSRVETVQIPGVSELDLVLRTGGVLVGRVTDQAGLPIAGARVVAQTAGSGSYRAVSAEASSGADGRYRIDTLGEGMIHRVTATKEGFVQVVDNADDNFNAQIPFRDGGTWTKDLVLGRGGRLAVTVRGPDGPVAGAVVTVYQSVPGASRPTATAGANGVATFAAIAPLRAIVGVRAEGLQQPGFPPANWDQALGDPAARGEFFVEMSDGAEATLEVVLVRSSAIAGRVLLADETPLGGVTVNRANAADAVRAVVTGADGSFRMPGVRPGSVRLAVAKEGFLVVGPTVAEVPAAGDCTGLVLRMAPAPRVHGTVRAAAGRLGEAFVQASAVPDGEPEFLEEYRWSNAPRLPIAADGTYDVPLPRTDGRFAVRVVALAHPGTTSSPVDTEPGKTSYQVDLELEAGVDLVGRIVALGSGEAVSGARVRAEWLAPGIDRTFLFRAPEPPPVRAVTDGDGNFVLRGVRSGRWEIQAIANGFLAESTVATAPQSTELVLALPADQSIEGVVQYPDGAPVASAQLGPVPQQGNRSMSYDIEQVTMSGPDGRFKIPRVPPGQFRISVSPPRTGSANFRSMETGIVGAGTRDLRIVVEPGASIAGRVVDGEGRGIGHVSVSARIGTDHRSSVQTLLDGTFLLVGLEDGVSYTVTVDPSGQPGTNAFAKLLRPYVAAGTTGLEFVMQPGLAIAGVLVDAAGSPRPHIEISAMPVGAGDSYGPTGRSDQDGKFAIRGLQTGRYRLAIPAWNASGLLLTGGDDVAAGATDLRLVATEGARIRGIVVDENGEPLAGIDVDATAAQAGVFGSTWTRSRVDGAFDLTGLVPDAAYDVTASSRGRVPAAQRGVSGKGDLRLVLARGLDVQGRLLDGAGKAIAGINLRFAHAGSGPRVSARTGDDGSFTVTGMTEGRYAVEASMGTAERLEMVPCGTVDAGQRGVELRLGR